MTGAGPAGGMSLALLKFSGGPVHDYATISDDSPNPSCASRTRRAATSAGISLHPFTRRNPWAASSTPAATQRSTIVPPRHQRTLTYDDADRARKGAFVERAIGDRRRRLAWDIGCNTGIYSRMAADRADYVLALDADHLVVDRLYDSLKAEDLGSILPLVADVADPSPGLGWLGLERRPLADRGAPDLILCLALAHHVVIGRNVPPAER